MSSLKRCDYLDDLSVAKVGGRLSVAEFLSNNGKTSSLVRCNGETVGFEAVCGKYLVICCVDLPISEYYYNFQSMIDSYSDLSRHDFEMVIVATPDSDNLSFHDFFSGLPCLAIPFSDLDTRRHICSFILSSARSQYNFIHISAILVDRTGLIMYCNTHDFFNVYGPEWFPFRKIDVEAICRKDEILKLRLDPIYRKGIRCVTPKDVMQDARKSLPLSLEEILLCDPSFSLQRIGHQGGAVESITVSELSKKHVGLYLCIDYGFREELTTVHRQCIANGQELEILLVIVPFSRDIKSYREQVIQQLRLDNVTSWLVFPNISKLVRRLWRVFADNMHADKMVILPSNGKSGELEGRAVIEELGIEEYPFVRRTILKRRLNALRSLTPASLFQGTSVEHTCLVCNRKKFNITHSRLKGKKLLLYLDWLQLKDDRGKLCYRLMKLYPEIRAMGWEVVFVPLDNKKRRQPHALFAKMPWPIMPVETAVEKCVTRKLFFEEEFGRKNTIVFNDEGPTRNKIIAIGEDGNIRSRNAKEGIKKHCWLNDSLFIDNLDNEIAALLFKIKDE